MNKEVLRSMFLEKRNTLTDQELNRRNGLLLNHCTDFLKAHQDLIHCHLFLPIKKFKEPDTWPLFHHLMRSNQHEVYLSKTLFKQRKLAHFQISQDTKLKVSKFGISEPTNAEPVAPEILDIVFVPLICSDQKGNRIGYGAGLYDRFLEQVKPDCLKVGVSLTPKLDNNDYASSYDIPLDYLITHLGVDQF